MRVWWARSSTPFSNHLRYMFLGKKPADVQVRFTIWPGLALLEGPEISGREGLALIKARWREKRERDEDGKLLSSTVLALMVHPVRHHLSQVQFSPLLHFYCDSSYRESLPAGLTDFFLHFCTHTQKPDHGDLAKMQIQPCHPASLSPYFPLSPKYIVLKVI